MRSRTEGSPDNSSARSRQAAQQHVETAYAHAPLMTAHDRRVLNAPLEERQQSRTSELLAWAKTMLPVINRSVRDARAQLQTGHQDLHRPPSNGGHHGPQSSHADSPRRPRAITNWSSRPPQLFLPSNSGHDGPHSSHADSNEPSPSNVPLLDIRQRFQSARTLSSDIRQYFPGIAVSTT
jgi:hypothetical protein